MSITLVTGPVRSGKSRHAEQLLADRAEVLYLATGRRADARSDIAAAAGDDDGVLGGVAGGVDVEWAERVAQHRARRPAGWRTLETADVEAAIRGATTPVLLDCLGTWLTAVVDEAGWHDLDAAREAVARRSRSLVESLAAARVLVVVVTNEVGWSLVPTTASGRLFQDELGRLNAAVSAVAARVHLVVAGRVVDLTGSPVVPTSPPPRTLDA